MDKTLQQVVQDAAAKYGKDQTRLVDVVREVQHHFGYISSKAMDHIARELGTKRVEVEGLVSFYAFLSRHPRGSIVIRLSNCVTCQMRGSEQVAEALEKELGIRCGQTTPDGMITLERTSCIGLCDQGPAALCNDVPVTNLTVDKVKDLVTTLRETRDPHKLIRVLGDGRNASEHIHSMVNSNIHKRDAVILEDLDQGVPLRNAVAHDPEWVINEVKAARLRGRGGAGFLTGLKWELARKSVATHKLIICNADEGEPGTFKDRVLLTELPERIFEGMAIAGYAVGAKDGIIYLRGEYVYLREHLDHVLKQCRERHLLGKDIAGKKGFDFDIRFQLGAGAYVCGEESALITSCEGGRGVLKDRPPFPAESGYLGRPTVVNNVETFCCAARILERGAAWFSQFGSKESAGTKLLSVSGDCSWPGVYELPYGLTVAELLHEVGGEDAIAVQVGGPSGTCVPASAFGRKIGYEDLPTGGSIMVFGPTRDMLEVADEFMDFFIEECCGCCTPCRVGNVLIKERLERIRAGQGVVEDLAYLEDLCTTVKKMSRCGLGQTSPNPVLSTLANFRKLYEDRVLKSTKGLVPAFDLNAALKEAAQAQGRAPILHEA